jgi:arylsulfatase A-like enzyme
MKFTWLALLCFSLPLAGTAADKPNIVTILVDDMGFSDLGCYGGEIPTPNLDELAKGGIKFTQFYNTARCCPTRAALLTGLYSPQAGVGHMTEDKGSEGYRGRLNDSCVTIAEVLKPAGYFTAMTGKWHLGQNHGVTPWNRGFMRNLTAAAGGFYLPGSEKAALHLNGEAVEQEDARLPKNWYTTDLWTTFGLKFVDEALAAKQPFYLHLCHNAPHFPLQAPAEEIAKFRGKYKMGWGGLRDARIQRQRELGIISAELKKSPRPQSVKLWQDHSPAEQDRFDHLMATYAATVHRMDQAIGDLIAGLKSRNALENTLILFMSDNGGNAEAGPNGRSNGDPTKPNSNWFSGESWAFLQNSPFRSFKHFTHEGGISTPLIAHWPQGITVQNTLNHTPAHLIDIMATCTATAGASYPKEHNGKPIQPLEGVNLAPAFKGEPIVREKPIFWEHEGNRAVRLGDWKLVSQHPQAWELYNIKTDRTELHNLAAEQPEKVKELSTLYDVWAERVGVRPWEQGNKKKGKNA